jgi:hypothetical protein
VTCQILAPSGLGVFALNFLPHGLSSNFNAKAPGGKRAKQRMFDTGKPIPDVRQRDNGLILRADGDMFYPMSVETDYEFVLTKGFLCQ